MRRIASPRNKIPSALESDRQSLKNEHDGCKIHGMRVERSAHVSRVERLLREWPVVALLGARQVGKTTLAREIAARKGAPVTFFDLEDPRVLAELAEPTLALAPLRGLVVLDEIQRRPEIFPVLRVLADRPRRPARFLVLGSASPELLRQGSESLAGRIAFHELPGFDLAEVGAERLDRLWFRGGFPRSYLARSHRESDEWRRDFVRTYVERDLRMLGAAMPVEALGRLWGMLAHWHGQVFNASELGRSLGVSHTTVQRYVDLLAGAFVIDVLRPWWENLGKRLVKSPKIFISDSGLLHALLGIPTPADLARHPKVGASWEGFLLAQTARAIRARREECHFWATHGGAELDLLVVRGRERRGFEFKRTDAPKVTPSMRSAMEDLGLDRLDVVHAGDRTFPLDARVRAVAARDILEVLEPL
jgi:predicted AAA+ superfamily ATPase